MNWQTIETAPKDGTPILGWDGTQITSIFWDDPSYGLNGLWRVSCPGEWADDDSFFPSHWMPLPEPPA